MLSQACVIPSVHWGGVCPGGSVRGVCLLCRGGGVCLAGPLRGVCMQRGLHRGGLHPGRGSASTGGWADRPQSDTMGYGQRAGGTHPTGMHPCFF